MMVDTRLLGSKSQIFYQQYQGICTQLPTFPKNTPILRPTNLWKNSNHVLKLLASNRNTSELSNKILNDPRKTGNQHIRLKKF